MALIDASSLFRGLIANVLTVDPLIRLVASVESSARALHILKQQPVRVVILDAASAGRDGLVLLSRIKTDHQGTRVILLGGPYSESMDIGIRALFLGASDSLSKPLALGELAPGEPLARDLLAKVHALGGASRPQPAPAPAPAVRPASPRPPRVQVLCIGCSTGGPEALTTVLKNLPAGGSLPIFVVQHMPPFFTTAFAAQLARDTGRPCREASHGEVAVPGTCYLAPGGYHMSVGFASARVILKLDQGPEENFCRPSVDVLFRSVAACFGSATLALVLTGMGKDGVLGAKAIVRRGGRVLVQDEASSVVWGMPGAVAQAGLASEVLPLAQLGPRLGALIEPPRP